MKRKTVTVDVSKVDWKLLRAQKQALVTLDPATSELDSDIAEGLISLIDDIQDQAAEQLGEVKVFGKLK